MAYVNVGNLRAAIADAEDEDEVFLASDAEGNSFKPLDEVSFEHFEQEENSPMHEDDDGYEDAPTAYFLWP